METGEAARRVQYISFSSSASSLTPTPLRLPLFFGLWLAQLSGSVALHTLPMQHLFICLRPFPYPRFYAFLSLSLAQVFLLSFEISSFSPAPPSFWSLWVLAPGVLDLQLQTHHPILLIFGAALSLWGHCVFHLGIPLPFFLLHLPVYF